MEPKNIRFRTDNQPLTFSTGIKQSQIQKEQYTLALLREGYLTGFLNHMEVDQIQSQIMLILHDLIKRYTAGKSSSVTTETAESLLLSIIYALDACLVTFEYPNEAFENLKAVEMKTIYEKGVERIRRCFEEVKLIYEEVKRNKLSVPVDAYNMTIDESIPVFVKGYGILFDAHNTMASIDYPLAIDDMRLQGVFYIKQYLERLKLENDFCLIFSQSDLISVIENFGRYARVDYRIELFNIFELVFHNALFSILSGQGANQESISPFQFEQLERLFIQSGASDIDKIIQNAVELLRRNLQISHPKATVYLEQCGRKLSSQIINAVKHNVLQSVIIKDCPQKRQSIVISLDMKNRMSDFQLRKLLDEIMQSETKEEKVQLIKTHFFSLHDYLDLLESDCLYGDEYGCLYSTFGDFELAILTKAVYYEELRGSRNGLFSIISVKVSDASDWKMYFIQFMKTLTHSHVDKIEQLIDQIDYEEIKFY